MIKEPNNLELINEYPTCVGNKNSFTSEFNIQSFEYKGVTFYYFDEIFKDYMIAFFGCLELAFNCTIQDMLDRALIIKEGFIYLGFIEYVLLLFRFKPSNIEEQHILYKRIKLSKRFIMLVNINIILFNYKRVGIYLRDKTYLQKDKLNAFIINIEAKGINCPTILNIYDELSWNKKFHINSLISDINKQLSLMEKQLSLPLVGIDSSLMLSSSQKDLLKEYCPLTPYNKKHSIDFTQLIYLFINDEAFISSIVTYKDKAFFTQFQRYLYELTTWYRFVRICMFVMRNHKHLFHSDDITKFRLLVENKRYVSAYFDPNLPFSTKKGKLILYLLGQGNDYHITDLFIGSVNLISKIFSMNYEKTKP